MTLMWRHRDGRKLALMWQYGHGKYIIILNKSQQWQTSISPHKGHPIPHPQVRAKVSTLNIFDKTVDGVNETWLCYQNKSYLMMFFRSSNHCFFSRYYHKFKMQINTDFVDIIYMATYTYYACNINCYILIKILHEFTYLVLFACRYIWLIRTY